MGLLRGVEVTKKFGGLVALNKVDFEVKRGEILGLIGPNGAGKTTLLNVISGVYRADDGHIYFDGVDITSLRPDGICNLGVGRTFQVAQSFPGMTVLQNVMVGCVFGKREKTSSGENIEERLHKILAFVGLSHKSDLPARSLNVAELKKLELARALATKPKLLLLDEINTGLNPAESMEAVHLIQRIREDGITVLIVEHVMRVIMSLCDRIAVLNFGQKIAEGIPQEIVNHKKVVEAYLGEKYGA